MYRRLMRSAAEMASTVGFAANLIGSGARCAKTMWGSARTPSAASDLRCIREGKEEGEVFYYDTRVITRVAAMNHSPASSADNDPLRWRMLAILAIAELLGMSLWFAGMAIAPQLQQ